MYAVIFRATIDKIDDEYTHTPEALRKLAFESYGCLDFVAVSDSDVEIAISYWENEEAIFKWKHDADHMLAQKLGQERWYKNYTVEVVEVKRKYSFK